MYLKTLFLILLTLAICSTTINGQNHHILSVYPTANFIGAARNSSITIQLDTELDTLSFPDNVFNIFGTNSGGVKGTARYDKTNKTFTFSHSKQFFAGEVITIGFGPVKTINHDAISAYHWQFTVKITKPTPPYFKAPVTYPVQSVAPMFCFDWDNNGSLDILSVTGQILHNNGDGTFSKNSYDANLYSVNFINDYNNDGNIDLIKSGGNPYTTKILFSNGNGNFTLAQDFNSYLEVIAVGDINGDNYNDFLTLKGSSFDTVHVLQFYINDKTGHFYPDTNKYNITSQMGIWATLADINKDGSLDMIVVNSGFVFPHQDRFRGLQVFLNDGNGHFTNTQNLFIPGTYGSDIISNDYNNDGNLDFALFNTVSGSTIVSADNSGNTSLMKMTQFGGGESGGSLITGDLNGDNRIDLLWDSWMIAPEEGGTSPVGFSVFLNSQVDTFSSRGNIKSFSLGQAYQNAYGAPLLADVNNDGALDIIHGLSVGYTTILINTDSVSSIKEKTSSLEYSLYQNYPNPFNPSTTIKYSIPKAGNVKLTVYNSIGSKVATVVNEYKSAGHYSVQFNGSNLASGIYLYRMEAGNYSEARKFILMK